MDRLIIGEVLKPQGIRGELKVKTFTDFPEDVKAFGTVYIDDKPYKILSFYIMSKIEIIERILLSRILLESLQIMHVLVNHMKDYL